MTSVTNRVDAAIVAVDPCHLVARLALVVVLINTHANPLLLVIAAVACGLMFLNERLLDDPRPWLGLAAVLGVAQFSEWWLLDDHLVATTYLVAAIGLSRLAQDPSRTLQLSARLIVGAIFAFAFAWKLLSSQYMELDFFRYTLLRDDRFTPAAVIVGGAEEPVLERQRYEVAEFLIDGDVGDHLVVREGPRTEQLARLFSWWGLAIEATIAVAFLAPFRGRARLLRPVSLLTFAATTYLVVPVIGFGLLLMTLGITQVDGTHWRRAFVYGSVAMFFWSVIMSTVVL